MKKYLDDAKEEMKRADHLLYVSLKYTRTVDVIRSTIQRLILAYDAIMNELLEFAQKKKKIKIIPTAPTMKADSLKEAFKEDEIIIENLNFYLLLRKLIKAKRIDKREEYRRHVTMTVHFTDQDLMEVNIDILKEYYFKTKEFIDYIEEQIFKQKVI